MKKYILLFAAVFCGAIYVAKQDRRTAQLASQKATQQSNRSISSPLWYDFVRWPNETATWAIILTLFAIAEQTSQTREATKAMYKSVEVQEAEFIQWVEIGDWTVRPEPYFDYQIEGDGVVRRPEEIGVEIRFPIVNATSRPLSIAAVRTTLEIYPKDAADYFVAYNQNIPPKGEYVVVIQLRLTGFHADQYVLDRLPVLATIKAEFLNALGKPDKAEFQLLAICGINMTHVSGKGHVSVEERPPNRT